MAEFASKGVAGSGLGLGIAGTALGLLNGGLGNILNTGTGCNYSNNQFINRYELEMENKIVSKDSEIALLKSNIYTDQKIADVYERLNVKINGVESAINTQADVNATMTGTFISITWVVRYKFLSKFVASIILIIQSGFSSKI